MKMMGFPGKGPGGKGGYAADTPMGATSRKHPEVTSQSGRGNTHVCGVKRALRGRE